MKAVGDLSTFSGLRHRNYRLFWTGSLVSLIGTWMQGTAQSYLVWELTHSAFATSLTVLFFSLPSTMLSLLGGVIADRFDRRRLLLVTQSTFMLQAVVLAALTFAGLIEVWHIYVLALVNGTVMAFDAPVRQSMIPSLVAREDLTNAIALNATAFNASRVIGPPVAGLLYAAAGPAWCFALNAVSYLAILYVIAIIRPAGGEEAGRVRTDLWSDLREGLDYVRAHAVVRTLLLMVALVGTFAFSYVVLMPVFASSVLGAGPAGNGFLLGGAGIGATLGGLTVASLRPRRPGRFIVWVGFASVVALVGFALSRDLALSIALSAAIGASVMMFLTLCNSTIQSRLPDALRGRVMSIYTLALIGSGPLNSLIAGVLGSALGAALAIAFSGLVMALAIALITLRNRGFLDLDGRMETAPASQQTLEPVGSGR
ncbi:MAG: MFS transporter [bacterium]